MSRSGPAPSPLHGLSPGGAPLPAGRGAAAAVSRDGEAPARDRVAEALTLAALLVGLLAFARLGAPSLWIDEAFTWIDASGEGRADNWLGYALVWLASALVGDGPTEAALRVAPACAGWLLVAATAWAFEPLAGARRAALAALVVAASPWHVYWAQNARFYTLASLATVVAAGAFVRGLAAGGAAGRGRVLWLAGGLVAVALGAWCHRTALLVLGACTAALVLARPELGLAVAGAPDPARRERQRRLLVRLVVAAVVFLAVLAPAATRAFAAYVHAKGGGGVAGVRHAVLSLGLTAGPALGVAAALGAAAATRAPRRVGWFVFLVPALGVGGLLALAALATVAAQYAFVFLPWIALLAAWPVGRGPAHAPAGAPGGGERDAPLGTPAAALAWVLLLVGPALASTGLQLAVRFGDRERWREALAHVESRRAPGEAVLALPGTPAELYLARAAAAADAPAVVRAAARATRRAERVGNLDQYSTRADEPLAAAGRAHWVVLRTDYLLTWDEAERARFLSALRESYRLDARFPVRIDARDLDLEVWRTR